MSRSPARRAAAALFALLFLLVVGEPLALHACPMHDGVAASAAADASHASNADHDAHASHGGMAPASQPDGGDDAHQCQCLGDCAAATGLALPTAQAVRWHVVVTRRADPPAAEYRVALVAAPHVLPFANGPPFLA
jgi:hypothetical protein